MFRVYGFLWDPPPNKFSRTRLGASRIIQIPPLTNEKRVSLGNITPPFPRQYIFHEPFGRRFKLHSRLHFSASSPRRKGIRWHSGYAMIPWLYKGTCRLHGYVAGLYSTSQHFDVSKRNPSSTSRFLSFRFYGVEYVQEKS